MLVCSTPFMTIGADTSTAFATVFNSTYVGKIMNFGEDLERNGKKFGTLAFLSPYS